MSHHPIQPPAFKPTEEQHRIAYLNRLLKDIVYEDLFFFQMAREPGYRKFMSEHRPYWAKDDPNWSVEKEVEDRFNNLLDRLFKHDDTDDLSAWERLIPYEDYKKSMEEDLASAHCGDCTAVAASCMRCHAEGHYGIPFTAVWMREGGKSAGWRLLHEWRKLNGLD